MNSTGKFSHALRISTALLAVGAVIYLFSFVQTARSADAQCLDISGSGTSVLVNGQANSGVIDFENQTPSIQYEACLEDPGQDKTGPFEVKGWAWNTNLGWVSFSCSDENGDGAPYENLGVSCGNTLYGVTMDGPDETNPGRLEGYAWSDNAGWISVNCNDLGVCGGSTYYVEAETTDEDCSGNVYINDGSCSVTPSRPVASVYAWADTVGWMSFDGVEFPWVAVAEEEESLDDVDVDIETITPNGGDSGTGNKNDAPYSNDDDSHKIVIRFTQGGAPLANPEDYTLNVELDWTDTVDLNQTDLSNGDYSACTTPCAGGAVTKPGPASFDMSNYGADPEYPDAVVAVVTSKAPTSDMNGLDEEVDGDIDFPFEDFVLGNPNSPSNVPVNELILNDIRVTLRSDAGCHFGNPGCVPASVGGGVNLSFRPALDVLQFNDDINGYFISAQNTVANTFSTDIYCNDELNCAGASFVDFFTGVDGDFFYVYDDDDLESEEAGADIGDPGDVSNLANPTPARWSTFGESSFALTPVCDAEGGAQCLAEASNAYVYSVASYVLGGQSVQYFNNKLPRVQGTLVVNPVADIRGNVYSTGVTNPQTGEEVRSIGELGTNILRDTLFRNVSNILAGATRPTAGVATIGGFEGGIGGEGFEVSSGDVTTLLPELITGIPKAYYFRGDVVIDAGNTLSWSGERTIIVEGGDLYIRSNLYNAGASIPRPKLGVIVLRDYASGQGGNVYVDPTVRNLQLNLYADGSLFTYDPASGSNGGLVLSGILPYFSSESDRFGRLKNQLYIQGSVASQNTIGGAAANPPILGDGSVANGAEGSYGDTPSGRSAARLYDLNFLRYYGLVFERDPDGNAVDKDGDGTLEAEAYKEISPGIPDQSGGDLIVVTGGQPAQGLDPNEDFSAVYVLFDPPSVTLPGFGVTSGVNVRLLP